MRSSLWLALWFLSVAALATAAEQTPAAPTNPLSIQSALPNGFIWRLATPLPLPVTSVNASYETVDEFNYLKLLAQHTAALSADVSPRRSFPSYGELENSFSRFESSPVINTGIDAKEEARLDHALRLLGLDDDIIYARTQKSRQSVRTREVIAFLFPDLGLTEIPNKWSATQGVFYDVQRSRAAINSEAILRAYSVVQSRIEQSFARRCRLLRVSLPMRSQAVAPDDHMELLSPRLSSWDDGNGWTAVVESVQGPPEERATFTGQVKFVTVSFGKQFEELRTLLHEAVGRASSGKPSAFLKIRLPDTVETVKVKMQDGRDLLTALDRFPVGIILGRDFKMIGGNQDPGSYLRLLSRTSGMYVVALAYRN